MKLISLPVLLPLLVLVVGPTAAAQPTARPAATAYLNLPQAVPRLDGWRHEPAFPLQDPLLDLAGLLEHPTKEAFILYQRGGRAHLISKDPAAGDRQTFMDLRPRTAGRFDAGLLSLAFHPEFGNPASTNRGFVYVWYAHHPQPASITNVVWTTTNRLSRFTVPDGSDLADPSSELVLIEQEDRHLQHMGGELFFSRKDGFLYLSVGDEGGGYDLLDSGQKVGESLFGGVIRIDVDMRGGSISHPVRRQPARGRTQHYYIPSDNPWVDRPDTLEEFWAIGLRNPFRMSEDPVTGDIWLGDVGQHQVEEINLIQRGGNYQWPYLEGLLPTPKARPDQVLGDERPPFFSYGRTNGFCVIGGQVYRGARYRALLEGRYLFADMNGSLWSLEKAGNSPTNLSLLAKIPGNQVIVGITVDRAGDIYVSGWNARIVWKLVPNIQQVEPLPLLLSETGAFADTAGLQPAPALLPYSVISPLWSDAAAKDRWLSIPHDPANPGASNSLVRAGSDGEWAFPGGTVFVKHFALQTNHQTPGPLRRLETRFLVLPEAGGAYGVTYRWRADGTDAEVLPEGLIEEIPIVEAGGLIRTQRWHYPSMQDCMACHTPQSGYVLGVNPRQLNRGLLYPDGTAPANQIRVLRDLGYLAVPPTDEEIAAAPRLSNPLDSPAPLHDRVRSYLDANCAHCHRPEGVRAQFDARYLTPLADQGLIQGPADDDLERPGTQIVAPGDLARSALYQRVLRDDHVRMPPLARNLVDEAARALLGRWIQAMPGIRLASPTEGALLPAGPLPVLAEVTAGELGVTGVEFWVNGSPAATLASPPYGTTLAGLGPGTHVIGARVRDAEGITYAAEPVSVTLVTAADQPTVQILSPAAGSFVGLANVSVSVSAAAAAGRSISELVLELDGTEVGRRSGAPYTFPLPPLAAGPHVLKAGAVDSSGAWGWSAERVITAVNAPVVQLTSPVTDRASWPLPNRVLASLADLGTDPRWRGYSSPLPELQLASGLPGPYGQPEALRFPPADYGASNAFRSGFYHFGGDSLDERAYAVAVWLRAVNEPFRIGFGLTDTHVPHALSMREVPIDQSWRQFRWVFNYLPCGCFKDERTFQMVEYVPGNGAWEIARPAVYPLPRLDFIVGPAPGSGPVKSLELWANGQLVAATNGAVLPATFKVPAPGLHRVSGRALGEDGSVAETPSVSFYAGPAPRLELLAGAAPGLLVEAWGADGLVVLQRADQLAGPWQTVRTNLNAGSFLTLESLDSSTGGAGFFRAHIVVPE